MDFVSVSKSFIIKEAHEVVTVRAIGLHGSIKL